MTDAQKRLRDLRDKQSKQRGRMAELAMVDDLTDEQREELDTIERGTPDLERQIRAATIATEEEDREAKATSDGLGEPDTEMRERIALRGKARLTNYLLAAAGGRRVDGPEAELQAAAGVKGIPVEIFDLPRTEDRERRGGDEDRVIAALPGTVGVNFDPIMPAVFANSIATRLGVDMPRVESGTYATGTISTSQSASTLARSAAAAGVAGAITVGTASPKRISARLELALEDIAAIGQDNFEAALRQNLAMALSAELDNQAINGNGTAPNLAGILQRLGTGPARPTGVETFDRMVGIFAGGVDGLWASTVKDVAIVIGPEGYRLAVQTFRDETGQDLGAISFADYANEHFGGFWTNSRMPAKASHVQDGILYRKGRSMMGASMGMRTAVCPHWGDIDIEDIYTGSAKAERYFTMHMLVGDVILVQPDAYEEIHFRVST